MYPHFFELPLKSSKITINWHVGAEVIIWYVNLFILVCFFTDNVCLTCTLFPLPHHLSCLCARFARLQRASALLALVPNLPARCPRNALSWLTSPPHLPSERALSPLLAFTDDGSSRRPPSPRSSGREEEDGERYTAEDDDGRREQVRG